MTMTATQDVSETSTRRDPRAVLPALWVFAVLNYLYCDVLGLMHAPDLQGFLDGAVGRDWRSPRASCWRPGC